MKKYINLLMTLISLFFMILSILKNNLLCAILGILAFIVLLTLFHEMGHALFCKINKNKITRIFICFFYIKDKKIYLTNFFRLQSFCAFIKRKKNAIVYLGGPIISFFVTIIIGILLIYTKICVVLFYLILSLIYSIINIIPYGKSDMILFLEERRTQK